jgi:hypothetical protein
VSLGFFEAGEGDARGGGGAAPRDSPPPAEFGVRPRPRTLLPRAGDERGVRLRVRVEGEPLLLRVVVARPAVRLPGLVRVGKSWARELLEPLVGGGLDPTLGDRPRPVILSQNGGQSCVNHLIKY